MRLMSMQCGEVQCWMVSLEGCNVPWERQLGVPYVDCGRTS